MRNKFKLFSVLLLVGFLTPMFAQAEEIVEDEYVDMELYSADVVASYDVSGSLFQQITELEQEKVLMQLEKERAQLDLELDRLAAEKIKLHMEIDTLSGRAEQQQQELELARAELDAQVAKLESEKEALAAAKEAPAQTSSVSASASAKSTKSEQIERNVDFAKRYRLVNVIGAGTQLQATISDRDTGQNKRLTVGKVMDGYTVKSISLDEGVMFVNTDGDVQTLNVVGNN